MSKEFLRKVVAPVVLSVAIGGAIEGGIKVVNTDNSGKKKEVTTANVNKNNGSTLVTIDNIIEITKPDQLQTWLAKVSQICDPKDLEFLTRHGYPTTAIVICERGTLDRGKVDKVIEAK